MVCLLPSLRLVWGGGGAELGDGQLSGLLLRGGAKRASAHTAQRCTDSACGCVRRRKVKENRGKTKRKKKKPQTSPKQMTKALNLGCNPGIEVTEGKGFLWPCHYPQSSVAKGFCLRSGRPLCAISFCSVTCQSNEGISHGLKNWQNSSPFGEM